MTRIDLHVDELLDRARGGALSAADRARLLAHCAACVTCRIELAWVDDDLHRALPSDADRAIGARAVEALLGSGREPALSASAPSARRRTNWGQATALAFAGLLLASAAAALYTQVQAWRAREAAAPASSATPASAPARVTVRQRTRHARAPAAEVAAVPVPPLPPTALPETPAAEPDANALQHEVGMREEAARAPTVSGPAPEPAIARERRAEALFARAQAARAAARDAEAIALYAQLVRTFPETRSAHVSRISQADLLLRSMDRPAQALASYQAYLIARPRGALVEEAYVGVALSAQRLGLEDEERTAWQALLDHHPDSPHAARARARLLVLSR